MAGAQIPTSVTILNNLKGFQAVSLNDYTTSAAASIAAGSIVEVAGAFFQFAGDETPDASTWTSIVTGNTAYITLAPSGTAGSQILSVAYTSTAPTWRDDMQGWYASAASTTRVIASVYKQEATVYVGKAIFPTQQRGYSAITPGSYKIESPAITISTTSTAYVSSATAYKVHLPGGYTVLFQGGNGVASCSSYLTRNGVTCSTVLTTVASVTVSFNIGLNQGDLIKIVGKNNEVTATSSIFTFGTMYCSEYGG